MIVILPCPVNLKLAFCQIDPACLVRFAGACSEHFGQAPCSFVGVIESIPAASMDNALEAGANKRTIS
jgi:hypothetical protein